MSSLANVKAILVPRECADFVQRHLREVGNQGYEGMGLWLGRQDGDTFTVTRSLIPAQRHIRTDDGVCVTVGPDELHRINVLLYREKLTLLAQIHSHPGRAYHSDTDDAYAVATEVGCLSLVVPNFARDPFNVFRAASYRLDASGKWRGLSAADANRLITITD